MKSQNKAYEALEDPLSGASRSTRRSIFLFSALALLIVKAQRGPSEISVFGLKFPGITDHDINLGVTFLLSFSLVSYVVSGFSDFFRFQHRRDAYNLSVAGDISDAMNTPPDSYLEETSEMNEREFCGQTGYKPSKIPIKTSNGLLNARLLIEFISPLVAGIGSLTYFIFQRF